jgi:hypothetical protein
MAGQRASMSDPTDRRDFRGRWRSILADSAFHALHTMIDGGSQGLSEAED